MVDDIEDQGIPNRNVNYQNAHVCIALLDDFVKIWIGKSGTRIYTRYL